MIYLATDMLEVRGQIEARGGRGGNGGDALEIKESSYIFLDAPTEITIQDFRDVCRAHGFGWDIVSIENADQVQAIARRAELLGISLRQGHGIPLAYVLPMRAHTHTHTHQSPATRPPHTRIPHIYAYAA